MHATDNGAAELEQLAAELDSRQYAVTLVTAQGRRPHLHVTNRDAAALTENVYCDGQSYWFGWAERIGAVADVAAVAAKIAQVLRALDGCNGS